MTIEAGLPPASQNPLAYTGPSMNTVPCGWFGRDPTTSDTDYPGMFIWGNEVTGNLFIRTNTAAVWDQMAEGSGGATVPEGGTGRVTLTDHSLLVGSGVDPIDFVGPSATVGQVLQSAGAAADPAFSTATYPATTTINQVLYSSSANVVGGLATANNGTFVTSAAGVPSILAGPGTTGQVLQANAAAAPSFSTTSYPSTSALGDVIYASAANTFTDLSFTATATRYLANTGGGATIPAWDQVDLANGITGVLPVANGGNASGTVGTATTVGAVSADVITFALGATPGVYMFRGYIAVSGTDGTPAGAGYTFEMAYLTDGAAATLIDFGNDALEQAALSTATISASASVNNAVLTVNGIALFTIKWTAHMFYTFQAA